MAIQIGSMSPRETHDSQEVERLRRGSLVTVRKNGSYAALRASQPEPGAKLDGGRVQSSTLRRLQGGAGLLEYTVRVGGMTGSGSSTYSGATVEIEMAQTERPILQHKAFDGYADAIELWRNAPDELRTEFKYQEADADGNVQVKELGVDTDESALKAARLILKGVESYLVFHPVVTVTRTFDERPGDYGSGLGRRGPPPVAAPGGYEYLKTADRLTLSQDGATWTRVEQWTGAAEDLGGWDHDLYRGA